MGTCCLGTYAKDDCLSGVFAAKCLFGGSPAAIRITPILGVRG